MEKSDHNTEHNKSQDLKRIKVRQAAASAAQVGVAHAEIVVQQRLNNFLMAASILLLGASATIVADVTFERRLMMGALSFVGLILSLSWSVLGYRMVKFVNLNQEILEDVENGFKGEFEYIQVTKKIAQLRRGEKVTTPISKVTLKLFWLERWLRSSNLLFFAPIAFALAFLVIGIIAMRGWSPYLSNNIVRSSNIIIPESQESNRVPSHSVRPSPTTTQIISP